MRKFAIAAAPCLGNLDAKQRTGELYDVHYAFASFSPDTLVFMTAVVSHWQSAGLRSLEEEDW